MVAEGRAVQRQYGELLLTGLSEEERGELARLLEKISENVEAALRQSP